MRLRPSPPAPSRPKPRRVLDRILASTGQMAVFTGIAAVAGFGIELILARLLAPAAYANMTTLVALATQLSIGQTVLQLATARQAARSQESRTWPRLALAAGGALTLLGITLGFWLGRFWRLPPGTLPVVFAIGLAWLYLGVLRGSAQGRENYRLFGGSLAVENGVRLAVTAALVPTFGVWGGVLGMAGGAVGALIWMRSETHAFRGPFMPVPWTVLGWTALGVTLSAATPHLDLLVVKHTWSSAAAGAWSALSLFGKAFGQLPWLVSTVIFPRVVRDHAQGSLYLRLSTGMSAAVLFAAAGVGGVLARPAAHLLFAGRYDAWSALFPIYLWAVVPVALYGLWVSYAIAQQRRARLAFLASGVAAYLGALVAHHTTMVDVMTDYAVLAVWEVAFLVWDHLAPARPPRPSG